MKVNSRQFFLCHPPLYIRKNNYICIYRYRNSVLKHILYERHQVQFKSKTTHWTKATFLVDLLREKINKLWGERESLTKNVASAISLLVPYHAIRIASGWREVKILKIATSKRHTTNERRASIVWHWILLQTWMMPLISRLLVEWLFSSSSDRIYFL